MDSFCNEYANVVVSVIAQRLVACMSPEESKELLVIVNLFSSNLSFLITQQLICVEEREKARKKRREREREDEEDRKGSSENL